MKQDEIIEMAKQCGLIDIHYEVGQWDIHEVTTFAKLVADKKQAEMQGQMETLYAMYKQACDQRDALMDQQRSMIAAMRGKLQ